MWIAGCAAKGYRTVAGGMRRWSAWLSRSISGAIGMTSGFLAPELLAAVFPALVLSNARFCARPNTSSAGLSDNWDVAPGVFATAGLSRHAAEGNGNPCDDAGKRADDQGKRPMRAVQNEEHDEHDDRGKRHDDARCGLSLLSDALVEHVRQGIACRTGTPRHRFARRAASRRRSGRAPIRMGRIPPAGKRQLPHDSRSLRMHRAQ